MNAVDPRIVCRLTASVSGFVLALALGTPYARGASPILPSGGSIAAGSASIVTPSSTSTLVLQRSDKAVVNWQNFSIGAGSSVTFEQPNSSAITLNRVLGPGASTVNGNLFANGQVWLINGNGILFGQGSRIDVGGLIATTSDMRDADFLAGKYDFSIASGNQNASVVNQGSIKAATGGSVVLSGARVANEGVVEADLGQVVLGGANAFSVDFDGDNLIRYAITAPVSDTPKGADGKPTPDLVSNSGTLAAKGGKVLMTARAARNVVNNVINSTGIVEATTASIQNGEIVFDAGEGGTVSVAGTLDVSGKNASQTGGTIALLADKVAVADGARLDASGDTGGGRVLIGGNLHGAGLEPNAQTVTVGYSAITTDATSSGSGGTVAITSYGQTSVAASISARGGANSGDGGTVETSGRDLQIAKSAKVDTSAPIGTTGLWLLDPTNIDVDVGLAQTIVDSIAHTNVMLSGLNDINVLTPVDYTSGNSLTFLAGRNLTVYASVENSGAGAIFAAAGWDGVTTAPASILTTPGAYGGSSGSILISGYRTRGEVLIGSKRGATTLATYDLVLEAPKNSHTQVGYGDNHGVGNIDVWALRDITLSRGQIGHRDNVIGGSVLVNAGRNITLAADSEIRAGGSGDALVLAAGGDFINQAGAAALSVLGGGRWLVYSNNPAADSFGDLDSGNRAIWNSTVTSLPPGSVTAPGNRYIFAFQPTVTFTSTGAGKTYGADGTSAIANAFTVSPVEVGVSGAYLADTPSIAYSGSPLLSSNGTPAGASVSGAPYTITVSNGTLSALDNYALAFASAGELHIDPATLTYTANAASRSYGAANPLFSGAVTGFVNGESQASATTGALGFASGANATSNVGSYAVLGSGLTANHGNYSFVQAAGNATALTIDPAGLTVTADDKTRQYGSANPVLTATISGLRNGDPASVVSGLSLSSPAGSGSNVGDYAITSSGGTALNYTITTRNDGTLHISPATLSYVADAASRSYGAANPLFSGTVAGFVNGENQATATTGTLAYTTTANAASNIGSYTITGSGLTANHGNYNFVQAAGNASALTIDPAVLTADLTGNVSKMYDGTAAAALVPANYTLAGVVPGDSVALNNPPNGTYDDKNAGTGKLVSVSGLALLGAGAGNYVLASTDVSGHVGVITIMLVNNEVLADLIGRSIHGTIVSTVQNPPLVSTGTAPPPTVTAMAAGAQNTSDATSEATSDTGEAPTPVNAVANTLGQSLSGLPGSVPSRTTVLIEGLLRQFEPPPGALRPNGVPPAEQVYSSWGNEAFWQ